MLKLWIPFWLFLILAILKHNFMDIIFPLHSQIKAGSSPSSVLLHEDHRKSYPIIFFQHVGSGEGKSLAAGSITSVFSLDCSLRFKD